MKKGKSLLLVCSLMLLLTGCVKFNANMDIKKDKSMDFSIIYAFDKSLFGDKETLIDSKGKKELEEKGFTISDYSDDKMKGFTISKKVANIDTVSSTKDTEYSLSGIMDDESEESYVFKVKKGILKNTYKAKLKFDTSDSTLNDSSDSSDFDFDSDSSDFDSDLSDMDLSQAMANMDLSFNVTLPYPAKSNNATTAKDDNKNLSWDLSSTENEDIEFEFELYNMTNIYIGIGVIALLIIIIIILIVSKTKKKNKTQNENNINNEPISQPTITNNQGIEEIKPMEQPIVEPIVVPQVEQPTVEQVVTPQVEQPAVEPIVVPQEVQSIVENPTEKQIDESPIVNNQINEQVISEQNQNVQDTSNNIQ